MPKTKRHLTPLFPLTILLLAITGCKTPTKYGGGLARVLNPDQYRIQYPARPDIEPGEIWDMKEGQLFSRYVRCPSAIHVAEKVPAGINSIDRTTFIVANASINLLPL